MRVPLGYTLLAIAAFMTIGFLNGGGSENGFAVQLFAAVIAIGIPGAAGTALLVKHYRTAPRLGAGMAELRRLTQSSEVLKLAERRGGRLTVVEVVAETALPAEAAEALLGEFVQQGLAEPEVTDKGLMVYVFADIQQLADKTKSRNILDA